MDYNIKNSEWKGDFRYLVKGLYKDVFLLIYLVFDLKED